VRLVEGRAFVGDVAVLQVDQARARRRERGEVLEGNRLAHADVAPAEPWKLRHAIAMLRPPPSVFAMWATRAGSAPSRARGCQSKLAGVLRRSDGSEPMGTSWSHDASAAAPGSTNWNRGRLRR
jgi:hypothetical protein